MALPQRVAHGPAQAGTRLRVVLQVLQIHRGQVQILSRGNGILPSLVIARLSGVNVEPGLDGPVKQVGSVNPNTRSRWRAPRLACTESVSPNPRKLLVA